MIDRIITALLNVCLWLERLRGEQQAPVTQPYEPAPTLPASEQRVPIDVVYLHRPENMPVPCSCVERRNGVLTTLPGCRRCGGLGLLRA